MAYLTLCIDFCMARVRALGSFNRKFTYKQELYKPASTVTYERDKYGLRGLHAPISSVDIVTVGSSTTEQLFVTGGKTWQDVFHSLTGIVIANAGIAGLTSYNHITVVKEWLRKIPICGRATICI